MIRSPSMPDRDGAQEQPRRQTNQNAYIESFNGRPRDECLNEHWFTSLAHAQVVIEAWRRECNEERPKGPRRVDARRL
jgi:transposase InsO family protein